MAIFPSFKLTKKGEELLNRCIGEGKVLTFTKFKIGNGEPTQDWRDLSDIQTSFKTFPVLETSVQKNGILRIKGYFDNKGFTEDKKFKEIGVFVSLEGVDGEFLYSYTNAGDTGDIIPAESRGFFSRTLDVSNYIGYATNITFNIEQARDYYDFNTEVEVKVAAFLKKGDKIRLWGRLVLGDIDTINYIVTDEVTSFAIDNGLYCELAAKTVVADVENGLKNLKGAKIGDVVEVLGYYSKVDGAGHQRIKKPIGYDGADAVIGTDGSIWGVVHNGEVNVSWFGAKGDGVTDDVNYLKNFFSFNIDGMKYVLGINKHYITSDYILFDLREDNIIDGNGSTIEYVGNLIPSRERNPEVGVLKIISLDLRKIDSFYLKNITIKRKVEVHPSDWQLNRNNHNIYLCDMDNLYINNCKFIGSVAEGVYIGGDSWRGGVMKIPKNIFCENSYFEDIGRNSVDKDWPSLAAFNTNCIPSGNVIVRNNYFYKCGTSTLVLGRNVVVDNNVCEGNDNYGFLIGESGDFEQIDKADMYMATVSNNTILDLGKYLRTGWYENAEFAGIGSRNMDYIMPDEKETNGILKVYGNTIKGVYVPNGRHFRGIFSFSHLDAQNNTITDVYCDGDFGTARYINLNQQPTSHITQRQKKKIKIIGNTFLKGETIESKIIKEGIFLQGNGYEYCEISNNTIEASDLILQNADKKNDFDIYGTNNLFKGSFNLYSNRQSPLNKYSNGSVDFDIYDFNNNKFVEVNKTELFFPITIGSAADYFSNYGHKNINITSNKGSEHIIGVADFSSYATVGVYVGSPNIKIIDNNFFGGYNINLKEGEIKYRDTVKLKKKYIPDIQNYRYISLYSDKIYKYSVAQTLDTPYHATQMSKLGILDSYHNYLTELHEYEKSQNVQSDSEIMNLNVIQPPIIPTEVEVYAKEYNLI